MEHSHQHLTLGVEVGEEGEGQRSEFVLQKTQVEGEGEVCLTSLLKPEVEVVVVEVEVVGAW